MKLFVMTALLLTMLAGATFAAPYGLLFTNVSEPVAATSVASSEKSGTSTAYGIFWLVGFGDAGINAAAKKANISAIHHIDKTTISLPLSIFVMETTTVYGK